MQSLASFWSLTATKPSHKATQPVKNIHSCWFAVLTFQTEFSPKPIWWQLMTLRFILWKTNTTISHPPRPQPYGPTSEAPINAYPLIFTACSTKLFLFRSSSAAKPNMKPLWGMAANTNVSSPRSSSGKCFKTEAWVEIASKRKFRSWWRREFQTWRIRSQTDGWRRSTWILPNGIIHFFLTSAPEMRWKGSIGYKWLDSGPKQGKIRRWRWRLRCFFNFGCIHIVRCHANFI